MIHFRPHLSSFLFAVMLVSACDREAPRTDERRSPPTKETAPPSAGFLLEPGRAGALRLGMPADSVLAVYGPESTRKVDLQLEGMPAPALEIRLPGGPPGKPSLTAELSDGTRMVWRIRVADSRFRTEAGIGPESTLSDLRARNDILDFYHGEGNTVAVVPGTGMSFLLNPETVPESFFRTGESSDIPDSAVIIGVFMTR